MCVSYWTRAQCCWRGSRCTRCVCKSQEPRQREAFYVAKYSLHRQQPRSSEVVGARQSSSAQTYVRKFASINIIKETEKLLHPGPMPTPHHLPPPPQTHPHTHRTHAHRPHHHRPTPAHATTHALPHPHRYPTPPPSRTRALHALRPRVRQATTTHLQSHPTPAHNAAPSAIAIALCCLPINALNTPATTTTTTPTTQ